MEFDLTQNSLNHIAIIMDGNGRWANKRGKVRIWGHRQGANTVREITEECSRLGVKQLTLYAFSYENWQRPPKEINYLMTLLRRFLIKEYSTIMDNNIRFTTIGREELLPVRVRNQIHYMKDVSANNTGMNMCLALSYGSRVEIIDMVKSISRQVAKGEIAPEDIDECLCSKNLYQPNIPDVDLLIRTGGDMRLSNFLLWQASYSELWFTPVLWPDFKIEDLHQAIQSFLGTERRFGKVPNVKNYAHSYSVSQI